MANIAPVQISKNDNLRYRVIGSGIIAIYGILRIDPILILGQSVGFIAYARNIILYNKELRT